MAQNARNQLGIIPEDGVELMGKPFNGGFIAPLIGEPEVVPRVPVFVAVFNDLPFIHPARKQDAVFVIGQPGKDLIGPVIYFADKSDPFFFFVLESHHVGLQHLRAF
ncbi:hypothetical protein FQZ97_1035220 [compost metagenome]